MINIAKLFPWRFSRLPRKPYFFLVILFMAGIVGIYYSLQYFWPTISEVLPLAHDFAIWEFVHRLIGSLFYIPLLYSLAFLWWRGTLVVWLLSVLIILPRMIYFYHSNVGQILLNEFYLTIPLLILGYFIIELNWRRKERQQLADREKERQNYLDQVFKAQEEERKRVAQEIHDDPIQRLTAIAINAKLLALEENLNNKNFVKDGIESIREMVISINSDLRRIILDLRPPVLDDLGLVPALRWLINGFKLDTAINAQLEVNGEVPQLSNKYSINMFRLTQEALNNIKRHSKATSVMVTLDFFKDNSARLTIRDNGVGFVVPKTNGEFTTLGKLGLIGMQQRAQFLNGQFLYQSEVGKGTTISLKFSY